jgi:hypothetical protein
VALSSIRGVFLAAGLADLLSFGANEAVMNGTAFNLSYFPGS